MTVFISHSFQDKPEFDNIVDALAQASVPYWNPSNVGAGASLRDQLREAVARCDVCVFIATHQSLKSSWCGAELGAFWGASKPVIVYLADSSVKDDLLPPIVQGDVWEPRIARVAAKAKELLESSALTVGQQLRAFRERAAGFWWSLGADSGSVGFATIAPDESNVTLSVNGLVYDASGDIIANWDTTASCINLKQRKLYYYWEGRWTKRPLEQYLGFGEITFKDSLDRIDRAIGLFWDTNLGDIKSTTKKSSRFVRCADQREIDTMRGGDEGSIGRLVRQQLERNTHAL